MLDSFLESHLNSLVVSILVYIHIFQRWGSAVARGEALCIQQNTMFLERLHTLSYISYFLHFIFLWSEIDLVRCILLEDLPVAYRLLQKKLGLPSS